MAIEAGLSAAGLRSADVAVLATLDARAAEAGVRAVAGRRGWTLAGLPAAELDRQDVPHPSRTAAANVGTRSVAEAAALAVAGPGSELLLAKRVSPRVTVAIARGLLGDTPDA